jgi:acyl-CoA hydrolase
MAKKPIEIGDLVEINAATAKLQKFQSLKSCIGVVVDIIDREFKTGQKRKLARVYWSKQKGKIELKIYMHRLKRVK